jgi:hypothetical protein
MISVSNRRKIILVSTAFLIMLMVVGFGYVISHGAVRDGLPNTPSPVATPGLVVHGYVRDVSGTGLESVEIYRNYASYPAVVIARTDANGYYQSDFEYIAGDEMVTVWAVGSGLEYEPEQCYWRHYYGYQQTQCNFIGRLPGVFYFPIITK